MGAEPARCGPCPPAGTEIPKAPRLFRLRHSQRDADLPKADSALPHAGESRRPLPPSQALRAGFVKPPARKLSCRPDRIRGVRGEAGAGGLRGEHAVRVWQWGGPGGGPRAAPQRAGISPQTPQRSDAASWSLCQLFLRPHLQRSPRAGGSLGRHQPRGVLRVLSQPEASLGAHHVRGSTWGHSLCAVLSGDTPHAQCHIPHVVLLRSASHVHSYLGTQPLWPYMGMHRIHGPMWGHILCLRTWSYLGTPAVLPREDAAAPAIGGHDPSGGTAGIPAMQPLCPTGVCCPPQQMSSHWQRCRRLLTL